MTIFVLGITNIPLGLVEMVRKMFIIIHTIVLILQAMLEVVVHLGVHRDIVLMRLRFQLEDLTVFMNQKEAV